MSLHIKLNEINKRWQIDDDLSEEEEFKNFKTRIMNSFSDIDRHVKEESIADFCNAIGIEEAWHFSAADRKWSTNIKDALIDENDPKKFYRLLELIFALDIQTLVGYDRRYKYSKDILYKKVEETINYSRVNLSITRIKNDIIFYPSGEKILDKELVNQVLSFLSDKPKSHFIDALKSYEQNSKKSRVKSIDSLRRSLEEFFRLILKNNKGLKANITEIGNTLKNKGVNNDIRNCITKIISYLDNPIFNNNSKHQDGNIGEPENEFMIYQVALLMRYLHKVFNN